MEADGDSPPFWAQPPPPPPPPPPPSSAVSALQSGGSHLGYPDTHLARFVFPSPSVSLPH
ncbi:UNVERIFIED_CONTAM: hypothetical protein Sradi_5788100 [Sesamum radiatum]|uniref:Uncharacterized protein n=1 Tax=Sesamum radiatum TaxID=300843 RepID=A0AAW2KPL2_SESRA